MLEDKGDRVVIEATDIGLASEKDLGGIVALQAANQPDRGARFRLVFRIQESRR
jgi:hypothetical protein